MRVAFWTLPKRVLLCPDSELKVLGGWPLLALSVPQSKGEVAQGRGLGGE